MLRCLLLGLAVLLLGASPAAAAQPSPDSPARWFPLKVGERRVYIAFHVNRADLKRKVLHPESIWREVVEERQIHGMRVVVVRNHRGTAGYDDKNKLVLGKPEAIISEDIFFAAPQGIDWRVFYEGEAGTDGEYRKTRAEMLEAFRETPAEEFKQGMDNWILPLPPRSNEKRWFDGEAGYYRVLPRPDEGLLRPEVDKKKIVGVEIVDDGRWLGTRWFEAGKGLIQFETPNPDPETSEEFPVYCEQLMRVYKPGEPIEYVKPEDEASSDP